MTRQLDEFRFGKRGLLRAGDLFRASRGPFFRGTDERGRRCIRSLARPGVYRFRSYIVSRQRGWINAVHLQRHTYETLYVTGRTYRSPTNVGVVNRPYRIRAVKQTRSHA